MLRIPRRLCNIPSLTPSKRIDTFVYRTGDVVSAQTEGLLGRLGMGLTALATVALPLAAAWMALGIWLGYAQRARANDTKVQPEGALA